MYDKQGNDYFLSNSIPPQPLTTLGGYVYSLSFNPKIGYYLTRQSNFKLPSKIYGANNTNKDIIVKAFDDNVGRCTGVVLECYQGTGKSLTATQVCDHYSKQNVPVILIQEEYYGGLFENFLASIKEKCVVLVDEFEKLYKEPESIASLLRVLDGGIKTHKLWLLTANENVLADNKYQFLNNRPSRIRYTFTYKTLDPVVIRNYAEDNLINKDYVDIILTESSKFTVFTMDILQALVSEINAYTGTGNPTQTIKYLNTKNGLSLDTIKYKIKASLKYKGKEFLIESSENKNSFFWINTPLDIAKFLKGRTKTLKFIESEEFCDSVVHPHLQRGSTLDYLSEFNDTQYTPTWITNKQGHKEIKPERYFYLNLELNNPVFVRDFNAKQDPITKEMTLFYKDPETEFNFSLTPIYELAEPAFKFTL